MNGIDRWLCTASRRHEVPLAPLEGEVVERSETGGVCASTEYVTTSASLRSATRQRRSQVRLRRWREAKSLPYGWRCENQEHIPLS